MIDRRGQARIVQARLGRLELAGEAVLEGLVHPPGVDVGIEIVLQVLDGFAGSEGGGGRGCVRRRGGGGIRWRGSIGRSEGRCGRRRDGVLDVFDGLQAVADLVVGIFERGEQFDALRVRDGKQAICVVVFIGRVDVIEARDQRQAIDIIIDTVLCPKLSGLLY